jgi:hypothetical protein
MADLLFVAMTIAFVLIAVGYVGWCDRIIGPDEPAAVPERRRDEREHEVDA